MKERIEELVKILNEANYNYYVLDNNTLLYISGEEIAVYKYWILLYFSKIIKLIT